MPQNTDLTTVVIQHPVSAGDRSEFVAWQDRVAREVQKVPGFVNAERIPPLEGAQANWTIIYRFDSPEAHKRWTDSPIRKQLQAEAPKFDNYQLQEHIGPFAGWIPSNEGAPPKWKTATAVLTAFFPTALLLTYTIALLLPAVGITALWANSLIVNACGVAFLTWILMPQLLKVIGFWMVPSARLSRHDQIKGGLICVGFLVLTAIVFYLLPAPPVFGR